MLGSGVRIGLVALFLALAIPAARAETIACPLAQATRSITNPQPPDWWTTPIVNNLTETRLVTIAGQQALQCVYGTAGAIQRYAPPGTTCAPTPTGFECAPIVPPVLASGTIQLFPSFRVDLDTGALGTAAADLELQLVTLLDARLAPINGAQMGVGDRSNRGYSGCLVEPMSAAAVPITAIPAGSHICARTNAGRISEIRIDALAPLIRVLTVTFTTWQ
jgi:hypothetical protein